MCRGTAHSSCPAGGGARGGGGGPGAARRAPPPTTVSRRIDRLEKQLGIRLFDRASTGWQLTEAGKRLLPYAKSVESTLHAAMEATQEASGGEIAGTARIVTPDGFGSFVLVPGLADLRRAHPGLAVELVTSTTHGLIAARDYDVAVTLEAPSPRAVDVERLADYRLKLYASREYLAGVAPLESTQDLRRCTLIWYVDAFLDVEPLRELYSLFPRVDAQIQTNNITGQYLAARSGLGIAPLPSYIAEGDENLVVVLPDDFVVERTYWLVVPRELARLARVQAVTGLLRAIAARHPELSRPA
ncbi:LysR family transcriptional regulator [Mycobacterium sp. GA-2829]|uniref:LysR family transcriptional regulator n=1 Tax=Mycobacterium sp. GA-2829 TaxID=1772283 RepID=UPI0009EBA96E